MNFKIDGVEVEFDFFDMDEKEDFDAIFLTANEKIQKLSNEHKDFDTKFGKAYCEVIVNMFEDLFGEEKTYEIFQGKTNIMKCTTAVKDLAKAKLEHDKLFQETLKEITGLDIDVFGEKPLNREQRRARKKYNQ